MRNVVIAMGLIVCVILSAAAVRGAEPIPGIGPVGQVQKLHTGLQFTEGPTWSPDGSLYFSDIPADRIYRHTADGQLETFLEPAGHTNGLMIVGRGSMYACSMDGRVISIDLKTKKVTPVTETYQGKRYNAPNDLVVDKSGGVYFTDPHFRAPDPLPQGTTAFYYCSAAGKVTRLGDNLKAPNGIILSPDEKTLYVIPSMQAEMWSYPVKSPGKIGKGKVFCKLAQPAGQQNRGGDGLTIDSKGNLYITSGLGLQVFNPAGKALGIIEFPEQPANATFGGKDGKTLFATARTSLYAVEMDVKGHFFPGKK